MKEVLRHIVVVGIDLRVDTVADETERTIAWNGQSVG